MTTTTTTRVKTFGLTMRFRIRATWNGNAVLEGTSSGVMAYSIMQHMHENFAGLNVAPVPALERLTKATVGDMIRWEHTDSTGSAHVTATCEK